MATKTRVLLIGSGGIGTITALNLEASGQCHVTAVLRSNFDVVQERGFSIDSVDHGQVEGWRPSESMFLASSIHSFVGKQFYLCFGIVLVGTRLVAFTQVIPIA
jgi:hypothetical protein